MKKIEVLGVGCPSCIKTEKLIRIHLAEKGWVEGLDYQIEKVTNPNEIAARGVLATPGVALDGKVILRGKIPSRSEIQSWFA